MKLLVPMVVLAMVSPASAESVTAAVVSAESASGCVTVAGASNQVGSSRSRWFFAFYPDAALLTPAGPCPEDQSHIEPPVICATAVTTDEGTELYLAARAGNQGPAWLLRVLDAGEGADSFGVVEGELTQDRCGAGDLPLQPMTAGVTLVITAA